MRKTFFKNLTELANNDSRIWLLTGDLLCPGAENFPKERFLNCGIAEQNMIGISAGLALEGKIPFCYSMSTFLIFRAYEFIRNDIAYQNLPVRLVGCIGPYKDYGISHNIENELNEDQPEDTQLLSGLPNFVITENINELNNLYDKPYSIYFRLTR